jgi:hypothetical protein
VNQTSIGAIRVDELPAQDVAIAVEHKSTKKLTHIKHAANYFDKKVAKNRQRTKQAKVSKRKNRK